MRRYFVYLNAREVDRPEGIGNQEGQQESDRIGDASQSSEIAHKVDEGLTEDDDDDVDEDFLRADEADDELLLLLVLLIAPDDEKLLPLAAAML